MRGSTNAHSINVPTITAYGGISGTPFSNTVTMVELSMYETNDNNGDYFSCDNNGKITVKKNGLYRIHYQLYGSPSGATRVQASYGKNNNYEFGYNINYAGSGGSNIGVNGEDTIPLNVGDTIFLTGWVASGSVTFTVSTSRSNHLIVQYLGGGLS